LLGEVELERCLLRKDEGVVVGDAVIKGDFEGCALGLLLGLVEPVGVRVGGTVSAGVGEDVTGCLLGKVEGVVVGGTGFGRHSFLVPFQKHNGCCLQGRFDLNSEQTTDLVGEVEG